MNKALKIGLPILGAAVGAAGAALFLIAPGTAEPEKKAPFVGRNFAHRGLHKIDKSIPENSLAAFDAAVYSGYGVELDVRLTADSRVVVFHDDELDRMCGRGGAVEEMTFSELSKLRLLGTKERIPLLSEVLATIAGRVPVIIEIKGCARSKELCGMVHDMLRCYSGSVCVESFDPLIVRWWRKNAPEVLRGQLSHSMEKCGKDVCRVKAFAFSRLLTNFLCRPQFIAYGICKRKPLTVRLCEKLGAMSVSWTSHDWQSEENSDAVIFEYYRPRIKFK